MTPFVVVVVFRAVNILPNRIMGTVGEHPGFPIEALSLSHCGQWLASCSHDQLVKFSDVREVLAHEVDGHRRLKRTDQRKVLSSKAAAERDFFGDLDPDQGESSKQAAAADESSSEDDSSDSESESGAQKTDSDNEHADAGSEATKEADASDKDSEEEDGSDADSDSDSQDASDDDDG